VSPQTRLFDLLPAVHRVRDADRAVEIDDDGNREGPLEALLELVDDELDILRDDVDQLYDDWFVETCSEWLVPYVGDLLGVRGLREVREAGLSQRAYVANTIHYRSRKGTAAVLEEIARDVTGWPAKAVEFFTLLGWTQHLNHVRAGAGGTVDLRAASPLELIDGPFDSVAHTVDVRHVDNARGRHNIPNVGVFLWRLGAYALNRTTARPIAGHPGAYRFNPLGLDTQLFNLERPRDVVTDPTAEPNVPGPVRRRALYDELHGISSGEDRFFAPVDPVSLLGALMLAALAVYALFMFVTIPVFALLSLLVNLPLPPLLLVGMLVSPAFAAPAIAIGLFISAVAGTSRGAMFLFGIAVVLAIGVQIGYSALQGVPPASQYYDTLLFLREVLRAAREALRWVSPLALVSAGLDAALRADWRELLVAALAGIGGSAVWLVLAGWALRRRGVLP